MADTDNEDDPTQKTFEFYLMYNWKKGGKPKIYKNDPEKKAGPYQIVEKVKRTIKIPEKKQYQSQGEINVPQGKITDMVVEEI